VSQSADAAEWLPIIVSVRFALAYLIVCVSKNHYRIDVI